MMTMQTSTAMSAVCESMKSLGRIDGSGVGSGAALRAMEWGARLEMQCAEIADAWRLVQGG